MTDSEEDFATMFEASQQSEASQRGQTIEGTIVAIGPEVALVNVGGKGEAQIEVSELKDYDGVIEVAVGDRIQATVVSTRRPHLSRRLARGAASNRQIEDAFRAGLPVDGKVESEVKGGYTCASPASARSARSPRSISSGPPSPRSTSGASTRFASSSTRTAARTSSSRDGRCSKKSSRARRGGPAIARRRRGADRPRGVGAQVRRVR